MCRRWVLGIALATAVIAAARPQAAEALALTHHGEAAYAITVAEDASAPEKNAAAELAAYLKQMTGAEFAVAAPTETAAAMPVIAVGPGAARRVAADLDLEKTGGRGLGEDGIVLKTIGRNLVLTGAEGAKRGTLYAVYEFLERECGVRWWTQTASFVPAKPDLAIRPLNTRHRPPFDYREALFSRLTGKVKDAADEADRARFVVRQRYNGHFCRIPPEWGGSYHLTGWCHTFNQLLPPSRYFEGHPDWYSEIQGKRRGGSHTQLCCTNDAMIAELTRQVLERIRKDPDSGIISVSQNDSAGDYCECERCRAMDQAEGSHAGSLLYCVNEVAEAVEKEFPGFWVETLAYLYTRRPPKTIRPRRNVIVRLAVIERSAAQPIDSEMNRALLHDLRTWKDAAPNLFIWDYVANMPGPYTPHPTLFTHAPDLRTYAANHARGVFFEGNHTPGKALCDFEELKTYLMSHAMWDPRTDENRVIDEFLSGYYGKAGPVLRRYLDLLAAKSKDLKLHCWNAGLDAAWLDLQAMNQGAALFDEAETAVGGDPVLRERVRLARLPLDHQWLRGYRAYRAQAAATRTPFRGPDDPAAAAEDFLARATSVAGSPIKFLYSPDYAVSLRRRVALTLRPASLPEALAKLPADRVVDVQDSDFSLFTGATHAEDPLASDGWAARMDPATANWSTQIRKLPSFGVSGKYHVYASVRCEKLRDTGPAFSAGIYDQSRGKGLAALSVRIEDQSKAGAADGQYQLFDLGAHELDDGVYVWFGTTGGVSPENVKAVYVDRVLFVRE